MLNCHVVHFGAVRMKRVKLLPNMAPLRFAEFHLQIDLNRLT
jgi:hypothetical protein